MEELLKLLTGLLSVSLGGVGKPDSWTYATNTNPKEGKFVAIIPVDRDINGMTILRENGEDVAAEKLGWIYFKDRVYPGSYTYVQPAEGTVMCLKKN